MFDRESSEIIWVSPSENEDGYGTWEEPFSSIEAGLNHLKPGYTLVLKSGTYGGNVTIQTSGTARKPIRITADDDALVEVENGCWFFYDTSDLIVSNITFKNSPHGAVSVIGMCHRNRFESLIFIGCGCAVKASCIMYFGGSGGENNIVEDCRFEGSDELLSKSEGTSIALMISEGDHEDGAPIKKYIIRKNIFQKYGYGILVGSSNATVNQYGHIVEYNVVENCLSEGILIKCGDTLIRGNRVENCSRNSICIAAGSSSTIDSNRIVDCANGIRVNGTGHSVINNCIARCSSAAVTVCGRSDHELMEATNLFIESNTFVLCGIKESDSVKSTSGIYIEPGTSCIIQKNLIYGDGVPFVVSRGQALHGEDGCVRTHPAHFVADDNINSCAETTCEGFAFRQIDFIGGRDHFENTTGFGASGWVLTPQTFDPDLDSLEDDNNYIKAILPEDDDGELIIPGETDPHQLFEHLYGNMTSGEEFQADDE